MKIEKFYYIDFIETPKDFIVTVIEMFQKH